MKKSRNTKYAIRYMLLALLIIAMITLAPQAHTDEWITRQVTDNTTNDQHPSLYNNEIAWQGWDGTDYEIYYWDGTTTTQITSNTIPDRFPSLYNGEIAWHGGYDAGDDYEIYYWNGATTTQITDNAAQDSNPSLYNGEIAWQGNEGGDYEIYYYNGTTTTQITTNAVTDELPSLYNGEIAWCSNNVEIYYYNGTTTTQIADNMVGDGYPSLYNGTIAWEGSDFANWEYHLYYWDGTTTTSLMSTSVFDPSFQIKYPSLYNGAIAWYDYVDDAEIYYYNGTTTTQITDNIPHDFDPSLYNGAIAWWGVLDGGSDHEIYYARLASAWIGDAIISLGLEGYSEAEILQLVDLFSGQTSGLVGGMDWTYLAGNLPGDTGGEVYSIGDSWEYDGNYYIKLGSGLEGEGSGVPELPAGAMPFVGAICGFIYTVIRGSRRKKT
ncbi:MAG: hypothetical protein U9R44_01985 [Candidatus Omnitrophota bacterium]|nr:hypothetical protein [Candidatus Omnitrophota bacterium]